MSDDKEYEQTIPASKEVKEAMKEIPLSEEEESQSPQNETGNNEGSGDAQVLPPKAISAKAPPEADPTTTEEPPPFTLIDEHHLDEPAYAPDDADNRYWFGERLKETSKIYADQGFWAKYGTLIANITVYAIIMVIMIQFMGKWAEVGTQYQDMAQKQGQQQVELLQGIKDIAISLDRTVTRAQGISQGTPVQVSQPEGSGG